MILGRKKREEAGRDLSTCAYCPKLCNFVCPVSCATRHETHSPWGKQTTLFEIVRGMIPLSPEYVEPLFACTECHACEQVCDHGVDVPSSLREGRTRVFEAGILPNALRKLLRDQPLRETEARRNVVAAAGMIGPAMATRAVLFPGCTAARENQDLVRAGYRILRQLTGDSAAVFQDMCCGLPYMHAGDLSGFEESARRLAEASRTWRTVVVLDPGCAWTIKKLYPEHGIEVHAEVTTLVEFVLPHLHRFVRRSNPAGPAFYHDPCHLGRGLGVYDHPREILLRLVAGGARDLHLSRESEPCCGGGGAVPASMPEVADEMTSRLGTMLREQGARTVITACPTCRTRLSEETELEVVDLVTLLADAL